MIEDEVRDLIGRAGRRPAVPAADLLAIKEAARQEWRRLVEAEAASRRRRRGRGVLALAASLVLALLLGWLWGMRRAEPPAPPVVARVELVRGAARASGPEGAVTLAAGAALTAGTELETAGREGESAGRLALRLSGGPSVRLDRDTRLRLVAGRRLELERGALYVDSGGSPTAGAVEIGTPFGTVRDVGTQFAVRLEEGESALAVRVREGSIELAAGGAVHRAAAGEALALRRDGGLLRGAVAPYGAAWDWAAEAAPGLEIEGRSLQSFLEWVTRETGRRLRWADPELERSAPATVLHGTVAGMTPDEALGAVLAGSDLAYRLDDGTLVVTRP